MCTKHTHKIFRNKRRRGIRRGTVALYLPIQKSRIHRGGGQDKPVLHVEGGKEPT